MSKVTIGSDETTNKRKRVSKPALKCDYRSEESDSLAKLMNHKRSEQTILRPTKAKRRKVVKQTGKNQKSITMEQKKVIFIKIRLLK